TPFLLIDLISLLFTPIYHVRYLFPFAGPFILLMAAALVALYQRRAGLAIVAGLSYLLLSAWSLQQFWYAPQYRRDDHRAAVAALAASWRPGDAILVNAGWVYAALAVYWPHEMIGAEASLPPSPATRERLTALTTATATAPTDTTTAQPVFLVTGSVDGGADLGWGAAESDFYAMPLTDTLAALERLPGHYRRLWHYRLYDTVSDPTGVIRRWLDSHATLAEDHPIPGRDFLRLQRYDFPAAGGGQVSEPRRASPARFGDQVALAKIVFADQARAGAYTYVTTQWQRLNAATPLPQLAVSLRLYGSDDLLLTQADSPLTSPADSWTPDAPQQSVLALPIPAVARPLTYTLELVVYDPANGQPLPVEPTGNESGRFKIGELQVATPVTTPEVGRPLAHFDYLDLIQADVPARLPANGMLPVDLLWLPQASSYRDTFLAALSLRDGRGAIFPLGEEALGGWDYPSGDWPPGIPVLHQVRISLPSGLPPGPYTLMLQLVRASDRQAVPHTGLWPWPTGAPLALGRVVLEP
nr:hypothetical protein [Caldilineaceae bacterium]